MRTKDIVSGIKCGLLDMHSRLEEQEIARRRYKRHAAFITEIRSKPGFSLAVKDNIAVKGIRFTAGSRILEGYVAGYDATAVERLGREFSIVGKASLDPFGAGSGGDTCDFGRTLNPHDIGRVPGGSSSGCAVAIALEMCDFALGSDTFGSARAPAAFCGIVGFRPTYGLVSRHGLIPLCMSLDTVAPMARDVWGVAYLLSHIAGPDKHDTTTHAGKETDYRSGLERYELKGKRVLVPQNLLELCDSGIIECAEKGIGVMKDMGAKISRMRMEGLELSTHAYYLAMFAEFSSDMQRYGSPIYGFRGPVEEARGRLLSAELKRRILIGTLITMKEHRERWYSMGLKGIRRVRMLMEKGMERFDLMVMPSMPAPPWKHGTLNPVDSYKTDLLTGPASLAGMPAVSIPCGKAHGLHAGLQIIGRRFDDLGVLGAAHRLEGFL